MTDCSIANGHLVIYAEPGATMHIVGYVHLCDLQI